MAQANSWQRFGRLGWVVMDAWWGMGLSGVFAGVRIILNRHSDAPLSRENLRNWHLIIGDT